MNRAQRRAQTKRENTAAGRRMKETGERAYKLAKRAMEHPVEYLDMLAEMHSMQLGCVMIDDNLRVLADYLEVYEQGRELKTRIEKLAKDTNKLLHDIRLEMVNGNMEDEYERTMFAGYHLKDVSIAAYRCSFVDSLVKSFNRNFDKLVVKHDYPKTMVDKVVSTFSVTTHKWEVANGIAN